MVQLAMCFDLTFNNYNHIDSHLNSVRTLIVDTASADQLREVMYHCPGGPGHLTEVTCLLPVQCRHSGLLVLCSLCGRIMTRLNHVTMF